jgi:hypothetical protein
MIGTTCNRPLKEETGPPSPGLPARAFCFFTRIENE